MASASASAAGAVDSSSGAPETGLVETEGVLVTSDEQTIVYLIELNAMRGGGCGFLAARPLDKLNVLVKRERLAWVHTALRKRLEANVFDEHGGTDGVDGQAR